MNNLQAKFSDWWLRYPCKIALRWMLLYLTDNKSTLLQKMTSHYKGLTYPIAQQPRASRTTSHASGLEQSFLEYSIKRKKMQQFWSQVIKNLGYVEPCITWANVDPDLCLYMESLEHNELRIGDISDICCYLRQFLILLQVHTLCSACCCDLYGWLKIFNSCWTIRELR